MRTLKDEHGFTLIELMLVIVLIGILALISLQYVEGAINKSRINADIAQGRRIKEAIDVFYQSHGRYPGTIGELTSSGYIEKIVSAQKVAGQSVVLDSTGTYAAADSISTNQPFFIELSSGRVKVYDISSNSPPTDPVWDSGS